MNSNKKNFSKTAVIGLDVEDWYHLDYLSEKEKSIDIKFELVDYIPWAEKIIAKQHYLLLER